MGKLHNAVHPYTFRGRMTWGMVISSFMAALIALLFSYAFSHANLQEELLETQYQTALYLLELDQKTNLTQEDLITITEQSDLSVTALDTSNNPLNSGLQRELDQKMIYSTGMTLNNLPVTYVKLDTGVLRIAPARDFDVIWLAFLRIIFSASSFLLVFLAMGALVAYKMSKPITQLTKANRQVQSGDFDVKLAADVPGEVGELILSFNSMTDALSRTAYIQKDFISSVSHEFRTPIASIKGYAHLLKMPGLTPEQQQEYVDCIARESDRLSRLSETLLRLSALEQQKSPASLSSFSLDEQVRQVILRQEPAWGAKDIDWQLDMQEINIISDEGLLSHVWMNIIQNAIKFSPEGGVNEIRVYNSDTAVVEIPDHGPGMDETTLSRIFDRFYQADSSRSHEGVGLGLCLVKRILDMLGGSVKVRSKVGEGSTFLVSIPLDHDKKLHGGKNDDRR